MSLTTKNAIPSDIFATKLGIITQSEIDRLDELLNRAHFRDLERHYDTAEVKFWEPCTRAFFVRILPGGYLEPHTDYPLKASESHHIVVQTNPFAANCWLDTNGDPQSIHMKLWHRYRVERYPMHWVYNLGSEPRIHLVVEF